MYRVEKIKISLNSCKRIEIFLGERRVIKGDQEWKSLDLLHQQ